MNKTVLITGASRGIGEATVKEFARAGWNVAATSRSANKALFNDLPNIRMYKLDVTDPDSIRKTFKAATKDFGTIDAVVNNAGYGLYGALEELSEAEIKNQFDTNVFGLMNVTREAIAIMRPNGYGTIIQVSSMGGRVTFPLYSIYHSSKWAVEGFSESLHFELRQFGIQIKIIDPGVIKTDFYNNKESLDRNKSKPGYGKFNSKVSSAVRRGSRNGSSPEKVAKVILKSAESKSNKLRYVVGASAPLLLAMRKVLPERAFYALIRAAYQI